MKNVKIRLKNMGSRVFRHTEGKRESAAVRCQPRVLADNKAAHTQQTSSQPQSQVGQQPATVEANVEQFGLL